MEYFSHIQGLPRAVAATRRPAIDAAVHAIADSLMARCPDWLNVP